MIYPEAYHNNSRRISQNVNGTVTKYLWDEASMYGDVVLESDGGGNPLVSYVLAGTELISQKRGADIHYYLKDGQGSTRTLVSSSGSVLNSYAYHAFGEFYAPQTAGTAPNNYLYTGQQYDSLTGNYSLRARHYDPSNGRFLSRDTFRLVFKIRRNLIGTHM